MKRIIAVILVCAMALCFTACREEVEFSPDNVAIDNIGDSLEATVIEDPEIVAELWDMYLDAEYVMLDVGLSTDQCVSVTFNDVENEAFENASIFSDGIVWFYDDFDNYYTTENGEKLYSTFLKYIKNTADNTTQQ